MRFVVIGIVTILLAGLIGCNVPKATDITETGQALIKQAQEGTAIPGADMSGIPAELLQMMKDQGVMDAFLAKARIHGQNPGLKLTRRMENSLIIGLDGVDLDAEAQVEGTGTQLPAGTREALIDTLRELSARTDPDALQLRQAIFNILGWNREVSPHNPPPGG